MALILADRVKVRSFSSGTGIFTLADTVTGFRGFSAVGDGNETYYGITDSSNNWEIGRGIWSQISNTLSRLQVLSSSNNGNLVNFPEGAKTVFCTFPAAAASDFTYTTSVETAISGAVIRLARTGGSNDDITISGTGAVSVSRTDASTITISSSLATQSAETTSGGAILRLEQGGTIDDITFTGTNGTTISRTDANTINIDTSIAQGVAMVFGI